LATAAVLSATALAPDELNGLVRELLAAECEVQLAPGVSGIDQRRLQAVHMAYEPLLHIEPGREHPIPLAALKRAFDLVVGSIVTVLGLPVLAASAAALKLGDGGPVLFRQVRIGRDGKPFTFYKLRTMTVDAEARLGELSTHNERHGPLFKMDDDPRVTRMGRIVRELSLDELPQLWNVLRGDMSFVGPRPERPFFVQQLAEEIPFYQQRHAVKPGVTGWAQVKYQYGSSIEDAMEKLRYDLYYIKHLSIALDLSIVFDTVKVIMFGKGAK
jgi:exopolysaccharide biosynthesis polyprenyl glycosylphosphotransferase